MLQIIVSVASLQNGSRKAVSGTGMTSMSDSLMACQPRMLEPSNPRPSSKVASVRASAGMVKCCHRPGKSMKRRSTARTSFSRIKARTSLGVTTIDLQDEPPRPGGAAGVRGLVLAKGISRAHDEPRDGWVYAGVSGAVNQKTTARARRVRERPKKTRHAPDAAARDLQKGLVAPAGGAVGAGGRRRPTNIL